MLLGAENWVFECGYCSTKVGSCGGCCLYYVEDVNVETLYCCEWYLQVWSFLVSLRIIEGEIEIAFALNGN